MKLLLVDSKKGVKRPTKAEKHAKTSSSLGAEHSLVTDKWGRHQWGRCKKVTSFDGLGKRVRLGTFGKIHKNNRSTGVPKKSVKPNTNLQ